MAWQIELDKKTERDLDRLDKPIAKRILKFLHERVATLDDPRSIGEALKGSAAGEFWKYRWGSYRIIGSFEDEVFRVLVVTMGSRRDGDR